jgi:hypothetical protein
MDVLATSMRMTALPWQTFPWCNGNVAALAIDAAQRYAELTADSTLSLALLSQAPGFHAQEAIIESIVRSSFARLAGATSDATRDSLAATELGLLQAISSSAGAGHWLGFGLPATHDLPRFLGKEYGPLDAPLEIDGTSRPIWWWLHSAHRRALEFAPVLGAIEATFEASIRYDIACDIASGAYRTRRAETCLGNNGWSFLVSLVETVANESLAEATRYADHLRLAGTEPNFATSLVVAIPLVLEARSRGSPVAQEYEPLVQRASKVWNYTQRG